LLGDPDLVADLPHPAIPAVSCCRTDVICSTEKRFLFTARPPGPGAGLCRGR
jgi:hypothetical protein